MTDWNDLRYFLAVAETGSTLGAGKKLRVSQTTAARRIAALERELGAPLFERTRRSVALTAFGMQWLPHVSAALESVAATGARIDRIEPDPLVSISDIAKRAGMTRAAISNYFRGLRGDGFPPPVARITSDSPLWDWADVARWLARSGKVPTASAVEAELIRQANLAVQRGEVRVGPFLREQAERYELELCA